MRAGWVGWIGVVLLGGCGEQFAYDNACQRIAVEYCAKNSTCDASRDEIACQDEFFTIWSCDPAVTVDDLDACSESLPGTSCQVLMPEVCYDALCSVTAGCTGAVTTTPTQTEES